MKNPNESPEAIIAGLNELRRRIKDRTLTSLKPRGTKLSTIRVHMTDHEIAIRNTLQVALTIHAGRAVGQTLVTRLALARLADEATRSMTDPVLAKELTAELMALRAQQYPAPKRAE